MVCVFSRILVNVEKTKNGNFVMWDVEMQNNKNTPLFSVIIPTYNAKKYLEKAIFSAWDQTIRECVEIIVIDDGSTDDTELLMKKLLMEMEKEKKSNRYIRYFKNKQNQGVAVSRNYGVFKAKGNYVAFLDADDWWENTKLEKQWEKIKSTNCILCATGRELMTQDGKQMGKQIGIPARITYRGMLRTNSVPCSSVVLRKDVAQEFNMCHDELHEDYILWLQVLKKYGDAVGINEPLVKSRMSYGGKSRNKWKSAKMQFGVYRYLGFGIIRSIYYFCNYVINGVLKYYK